MKVLSLTQPWASLVASGAKRIETRSWRTNYRGPLLIHASKAWPKEARQLCDEFPFFNALQTVGLSTPTHHNLPLGAIVAICSLRGAWRVEEVFERFPLLETEYEMAFGDYSTGRYAWLLENVRPLPEPIPCRGVQGLWTVPPDIEVQIEAMAGRN